MFRMACAGNGVLPRPRSSLGEGGGSRSGNGDDEVASCPAPQPKFAIANFDLSWQKSGERYWGKLAEVSDLRHRADHLGDLADDFADLVFADDQRRRQRQGVAGDPQHQVVVVERAVERVEAALARQVGA